MKIRDMLDRKRELGLSNEMIAERSGVPVSTLQKIFSGTTKAPRRKTLEAIEKVLCPEPPQTDRIGYRYYSQEDFSQMVREAESAYSAAPKTRHSVEDYLALPRDVRTELIDGKYYQMEAPTTEHQEIIGEIYIRIKQCIRTHGMPCHVYASPVDVQLDKDRWTMVEPDLIIVCDRSIITKKRFFGAPDFVMEVTSPSTRSHDMFLKLHKYQNAGVREYWVIDPVKRKVIVYRFDEDQFPALYGFDDRIKIGISGGLCEIDFHEISEEIAYLADVPEGNPPEEDA